MKNTDAALISRILDGDENAFTELVEKYQKQVHALRAVGNRRFHSDYSVFDVRHRQPATLNPCSETLQFRCDFRDED